MYYLFHGYRFGEIAGLVDRQAFGNGKIVGKELRNHIKEQRCEKFQASLDTDYLLYGMLKLGAIGDNDGVATTSKDFF